MESERKRTTRSRASHARRPTAFEHLVRVLCSFCAFVWCTLNLHELLTVLWNLLVIRIFLSLQQARGGLLNSHHLIQQAALLLFVLPVMLQGGVDATLPTASIWRLRRVVVCVVVCEGFVCIKRCQV